MRKAPPLGLALAAGLVLATALGVAGRAVAQVDGPHVRAGFHVGRPWAEDRYDLKDRALYSFRLGWAPNVQWSFLANLDYVNSYGVEKRSSSADLWSYGARAVTQLRPLEPFSPYLSLGTGMVSVVRDEKNRHSLFAQLGAGLRLHLHRHVALETEAQLQVARYELELARNLAWTAGLSVGFGSESDQDGDGVSDGRDACPDTPRGAEVDARGCPFDDDLDGVPRGLDRCPGTPLNVPVDADGCPVRRIAPERDGGGGR